MHHLAPQVATATNLVQAEVTQNILIPQGAPVPASMSQDDAVLVSKDSQQEPAKSRGRPGPSYTPQVVQGKIPTTQDEASNARQVIQIKFEMSPAEFGPGELVNGLLK